MILTCHKQFFTYWILFFDLSALAGGGYDLRVFDDDDDDDDDDYWLSDSLSKDIHLMLKYNAWTQNGIQCVY